MTVAASCLELSRADRIGEGEGLVRREAAAVVGEPLHRLRRPEGGEAALDGEQHEVAHGDPTDAARAGGPGEDLAIVAVDGEGDPHGVAVPARDLEHWSGPRFDQVAWREGLGMNLEHIPIAWNRCP